MCLFSASRSNTRYAMLKLPVATNPKALRKEQLRRKYMALIGELAPTIFEFYSLFLVDSPFLSEDVVGEVRV